MSLSERLDLTRPDRQKQNKLRADPPETVPIWEHIDEVEAGSAQKMRINCDLRRPERPKCQVCRRRVQTSWRVCPDCGWILQQQTPQRHCIWVRVENLGVPENKRQMWSKILADAFSKVFSAFRSVNIFLTTDNPDVQEWGEDFTQVFVVAEDESVDYLGIASFSLSQVTKITAVRFNRICNASYLADLTLNQLSNLIANTIAYEIGHTLGLDHSDFHTDVMHDGLDHRVHSLMPPSFHAEQIVLMNHAIAKYKT
ncbi:MAG: hypothetical protein QNJ55_32730 [Xenococcus sp. MO_188.B8]|nr:hypothetical protein [Xenococcus sp. MO_188.B8]